MCSHELISYKQTEMYSNNQLRGHCHMKLHIATKHLEQMKEKKNVAQPGYLFFWHFSGQKLILEPQNHKLVACINGKIPPIAYYYFRKLMLCCLLSQTNYFPVCINYIEYYISTIHSIIYMASETKVLG